MIKGMQEAASTVSQIEQVFRERGGLKNIVFVACGGSLSSSYPARYLLNAESRTLRVTGYNSSEFVHATPKFVGEDTLVIATSTKATRETVEALKLSPLAHHAKRLVSSAELTLWYGERRVCGPLSFSLEQGERAALEGRNGSGKSSLLKLL